MLALLHRFAALMLIMNVLGALLPPGSLRRTAMMAAGLITAMCFLGAAGEFIRLPEAFSSPASVLVGTGLMQGE